VALGRYAATEGQFRVLVPLANPANVDQLIALASAVASERHGEIVALRVALVPEQMPFMMDDAYVDREREILELAHSSAVKYGAHLTSLVRVGHHPARAILETARERNCDLILLGWKGFTSTAKRILGEVADAVVSHARSDIMLVKMVGRKNFQRFLLPTAGGEHARHAEAYISSIVRKFGGKITVASVAQPKASKAMLSEINERLHDARMRLSKDNGIEVESKLIRHSAVTAGILREAKKYDAVVVGATGRGVLPQILFGQIPEQIAKRSTRPVILVKRYHPVKAMLARVMRD